MRDSKKNIYNKIQNQNINAFLAGRGL